ncbi:MAG: nuclear transport factor 2 family protein [Actinomycetota bacterium]|nr:nuclear transport factor 2 family protein [Actinomycetota bacterium]
MARRWLDAFNAHRPDLVVEHFRDDVTATSPVIARLLPDSEGTLRSKSAVLSFYRQGLALVPELRFTLVEVLCGMDQITIVYRNQTGTLVAETLTRDPAGMVRAVNVTYGVAPPM